MSQKSMLLHYRKNSASPYSEIKSFSEYDFRLGLWKNEKNEPLIKKFLDGTIHKVYGTTIETRTREGVDRSEISNDTFDILFQSILTFTREAIDRSETTK